MFIPIFLSFISIDGFRMVSYSDSLEHHTLIKKSSIIFELNGNYYYIVHDMDKLIEISNMPKYLQEEWFWMNKKVLTEEFTKAELDKRLNQEDQELKSILREFRINKII